MKRPEGFDTPRPNESPARNAPRPERSSEPAPKPTAQPTSKPKPRKAATASAAAEALSAAREARQELRRAAAARRRAERAEMRRFTRQSRRRRITWLTVGGVTVALLATVAVAVFSPLLALRTIDVRGTSRISADEVHAALDAQIGTPLALLDLGRIHRELSEFALIRSYVTETVPPNTLIVQITERQPVGAVQTAEGFDLVDPAGVVVQHSAEREPGIPVIDLADQGTDSAAFRSVAEVLLALPAELLARVDSVRASTKDDVALVLTGVGQGVAWGSAEESALKARVLVQLMAQTDPARAGTFDVSAPTIAVFRPA